MPFKTSAQSGSGNDSFTFISSVPPQIHPSLQGMLTPAGKNKFPCINCATAQVKCDISPPHSIGQCRKCKKEGTLRCQWRFDSKHFKQPQANTTLALQPAQGGQEHIKRDAAKGATQTHERHWMPVSEHNKMASPRRVSTTAPAAPGGHYIHSISDFLPSDTIAAGSGGSSDHMHYPVAPPVHFELYSGAYGAPQPRVDSSAWQFVPNGPFWEATPATYQEQVDSYDTRNHTSLVPHQIDATYLPNMFSGYSYFNQQHC